MGFATVVKKGTRDLRYGRRHEIAIKRAMFKTEFRVVPRGRVEIRHMALRH